MSAIGTIGPYVETEEDFESYISRFECFIETNSIPTEKTVCTFLAVVGAKPFKLIKNLVSPKQPVKCTFEEMKKALKAHYRPQTLVIYERYKFYSRNQMNGESISNFVVAIKDLASTCEFGSNLEEMLRDRFVMGVKCLDTQRFLLSSRDLTFTKAVESATSRESAFGNAKEMGSQLNRTSTSNTAQTVNSVKSNSGYSKKPNSNKQGSQNQFVKKPTKETQSNSKSRWEPSTRPNQPCSGCGSFHWKKDCPFRNAECRKCGIKGHIAKVCFTKNKTTNSIYVEPEDANEVNSMPSEYLFHNVTGTNSISPYVVHVNLNWVEVPFELDTGAARTVISKKSYDKTFTSGNLPKIVPSTVVLKKYGNVQIPVCGEAIVTASTKEKELEMSLVIVNEEGPTLLGRDWIEALELSVGEVLLSNSNKPTSIQTIAIDTDEILREFPTLFDETKVGNLKDALVTIDVLPDAHPKYCNAKSIPHALREKVDVEIDKLLKDEIIEPVKYAKWAAPIVPVLKPNKSVRICGDYCITCNKALILDKYPLPKVEELFGSLAGGQYFSKLDMSQAYMQLSLDEESKDLTTINTHRGLFRYNRLCFGIASAPGIFQRTMESVLGRIPGVAIFLDDILISGKTKREHLARLRLVLRKLEDAGLKLSKAKCTWLTEQVEYLGYKIDSSGIHPTNEKLEAIKNAPAPKDTSQLKAYLGLLNFYQKFIPKAATLLEPLNKLLRSDVKWVWNREQEVAFEKSKEALINSTVLVHYDPSLPITVSADSSSYGVGAVLSHRIDGVDRPVYFVSRTLTEVERRYGQVEREALALVFAVKRFHFYLWGQKFKLITDHKPLLGLFTANKCIPTMASGRIQRWALILQAYSFDLVHCSGKLLGSADALSRLPLANKNECIPIPSEWIDTVEFMENTPVTSKEIAKLTKEDPILSKVFQYCYTGWPNKVESDLVPFRNRHLELSIQGDCILWGHRIIIPTGARDALMRELHAEHMGASKMKELARKYFWWPGLDGELESLVNSCANCLENRDAPKKSPLHPWEWPTVPWHRVHVDYAGPINGTYYLVLVDAHSKWVEIFPTQTITSNATISLLRSCFARLGLPIVLVSDNGTCFTSAEFQNFMNLNGIRHVFSAPYHPSTNGLAENMVRTFKAAIRHVKGEDVRLAIDRFLLKYRITPHTTTGKSPSELLMGRRIRSVFDLLRPFETIQERVFKQQEKQKLQHDPRVPRSLEFSVDDPVMIRNYAPGPKWIPGTVKEQTGPVSYKVTTEDGIEAKRHQDQVCNRNPSPVKNSPKPSTPLSPNTPLVRRSERMSRAPERLNL